MTTTTIQDADRAFARIVRMLNASEQSSIKVREKLARAGYDEDIVDQAISHARECGIIDDSRYAETLIRSTISQGKGFRFVRAELEELGIDLEDVEAYRDHKDRTCADASPSDDERALAFLQTHPPRAKNLRDAAFRKLMGKGYDTDTAASVARRWSEAQR